MEFNITELMGDYIDHEFSPVEDRDASIERIKAMTMEKLNRGKKKSVRKLGRTLLIAAVLVAVLVVAAFAVYQATMADRAIVTESDHIKEPILQYSPVGYPEPVEKDSAESSTHMIPGEEQTAFSAADSDNPEYFALKEWQEYFWNRHAEDMDVLLPADHPIRGSYICGYEGMAEKLTAIAEKYGLRLYVKMGSVSGLDEFYAVSGLESFAELTENYSGDVGCVGQIYDEGSFQLDAVSIPFSAEGNTVAISVMRAMKGTLCEFTILGDDPENYVNEVYATADGTEVEIALGHRYSMIFAERENCYVTVFVNGGTNPGMYLTLLDMDDLKYIADGIDFEALDDIGGDETASAVEELYAEYKSAMAMNTKTPEKAEEVFSLLGDHSLPVVPDGYCSGVADCFAPEDSLNSLWQEFNDGCFATVHISYASESGEDTITLNYSRYWGDVERTTSITQGQYEAQKTLMQEEYELNPHLFSSEITDCAVNGYEAFYYTSESRIALCWMDTESDLFYTLAAPASFIPETVITLAESISMK